VRILILIRNKVQAHTAGTISTTARIQSARVLKYYLGKLMGDSPELMPLDSSLFNDLIESVAKHVCSTFQLDKDHPEKYSMATPACKG
jgi:hypothetical protein